MRPLLFTFFSLYKQRTSRGSFGWDSGTRLSVVQTLTALKQINGLVQQELKGWTHFCSTLTYALFKKWNMRSFLHTQAVLLYNINSNSLELIRKEDCKLQIITHVVKYTWIMGSVLHLFFVSVGNMVLSFAFYFSE